MSVYVTRRENARRLAGSARGAATQFANKIGVSRQQVNHIIGIKPIKNIGEEQARKIEQVFGMPVGWIDEKHENKPKHEGDLVSVPLLAEVAALQDADALRGEPVVSMKLSKEWIRTRLGCPQEHVAIMTSYADSMAPSIEPGALLFVDRGATKFEASGVYVIARGAGLYVLRLHRNLAGDLVASCDNKAYPDQVIDIALRSEMLILGRVLMAMNKSKL